MLKVDLLTSQVKDIERRNSNQKLTNKNWFQIPFIKKLSFQKFTKLLYNNILYQKTIQKAVSSSCSKTFISRKLLQWEKKIFRLLHRKRKYIGNVNFVQFSKPLYYFTIHFRHKTQTILGNKHTNTDLLISF